MRSGAQGPRGAPGDVDCLTDIVQEEEHDGPGEERRATTVARHERGASPRQRRGPGEPGLGDATGRAGIRSDRYKEALRFLLEEAALMEDERPRETMGGGLPRGKL